MRWAMLSLSLLVVAMLGVALWRQEVNRPPSLAELTDALRSDKVNLTIHNEWRAKVPKTTIRWRDANGNEKSTVWTTEPNEGETAKQLSARHIQEVADFESEVVAAGGTIL